MASTEQGQNAGSQSGNEQQQNQVSAQQGQQQLLQQTTTPQNTQGQNQQMQQQLVIQQPQYLQQVYNAQGQPQLQIMPPQFINHGLNSLNNQIQVITASGKTYQPNQLNNPHMLATSGGYTIPTSAANNQAYIIGQILNSTQNSILQQHQHQGKPGEMQKVIQPQITQTGLPQGLTWASPFGLQNQIFIRGTQPDQQPMYIQQQQPLHSNTGSHQQFTMPQTNGLQQAGQTTQNNQVSVQQNQQAIQPANGNVLSMSMKGATLQPKPLQIQPSPNTSTNQQQQQQQTHQQQLQTAQVQNLNVTMGGQQFQMIPQQGQQILTQTPQTITTQVIPQGQQQRQLILPQQTGQQVTFIQQPQQAIRPNYTVTATGIPTSQQGGTPTTATAPQQRPKIRKPVGRGMTNQTQGQNAQSPNQGNKVMYPRPAIPNAGVQIQSKGQSQQQTTPTGATITRVGANLIQQQHNMQQPLKTINISALHTPPTLPDATLTPLIPQNNSQITATLIPPPVQTQTVQLYTTTQLPTPNISITPAPPKKEESGSDKTGENRGRETEKENTKLKTQSSDDTDDNKNKLPKAMVKPQAQILTHVIEGFVIQEASEPFPPVHKNGECDEPPKKKLALSGPGGEMGKCEMCGKVDLKSKFKKNKRFCSSACWKSKNKHNQQSMNNNSMTKGKNNKKWNETGDGELTDETSSSVGDSCISPAPRSDINEEDPKMNPVKWNVSDVADFVRNLPGCSEYADDFAVQEIDGQALMLLKADHLMSAIGMKLGPALKLCAKIEVLKVVNGI